MKKLKFGRVHCQISITGLCVKCTLKVDLCSRNEDGDLCTGDRGVWRLHDKVRCAPACCTTKYRCRNSSLSGREDLSWQGVRQQEGLRGQNCHEKAKVGEM